MSTLTAKVNKEQQKLAESKTQELDLAQREIKLLRAFIWDGWVHSRHPEGKGHHLLRLKKKVSRMQVSRLRKSLKKM